MPKGFESWQFWSAAKKTLGETRILMILGRRNGRTIRMYSADPRYTQDRCRDPLEHLHAILSELDTFGRGDIARLAIEYLLTAVEDRYLPPAAELQQTMNLEILMDYQAVSDLQKSISGGASTDEVAALAEEAKREIDRTLAKYLEESR